MRNKLIMMSVIPALFLAAPAMADKDKGCDKSGKHGQMAKNHKKGDGVPPMLRGIELTEAQKAEIKSLVEAQHADKKDRMQSHWQTHKQLAKLSFADELDQAKLDALVADATEAHAQRLTDRANLNSAIFNVLTADQQQQLVQKMAEFEQKMQDRKKH